jgi:hypothetical protein
VQVAQQHPIIADFLFLESPYSAGLPAVLPVPPCSPGWPKTAPVRFRFPLSSLVLCMNCGPVARAEPCAKQRVKPRPRRVVRFGDWTSNRA